MTTATVPQIVDLGGPEGGRYWRVVTEGVTADHPDAQGAAVHARVTGSVGCTYNDVKVERDSLMPERVATALKVAGRLVTERVDYDTAEGYFLDHVCNGVAEAQTDRLMEILDEAYGK